MSLRIIGGELRRRHLKTPQGVTTRPYTDRVRQIVFDRMVDIVPSARVADILRVWARWGWNRSAEEPPPACFWNRSPSPSDAAGQR